MNRLRRCAALSLVLALGIAPFGCGGRRPPQLASVSGKVTLEGQPVSSGEITFEATEGGFASSAHLEPDGTYALKSQWGTGIPIGLYRVAVTTPNRDPLDPAGKGSSPPKSIPQKYQSFKTSGLRAEVKPEGGFIDFDLKK